MYLDLETAYDKAIAGEMDADADSFYKFDNSNSSFSRAGELVIVSDDETLVPYEIDEDGNFVAVDAEGRKILRNRSHQQQSKRFRIQHQTAG